MDILARCFCNSADEKERVILWKNVNKTAEKATPNIHQSATNQENEEEEEKEEDHHLDRQNNIQENTPL